MKKVNGTCQNTDCQKSSFSLAEMIKMVFAFMVITISIGGLITVTNFYTHPIIVRQKMKKDQETQTVAGQLDLVRKVIPSASSVQKLGIFECNGKNAEYYSVKTNGQITAYAIISYGKGYSSLIKTLVAVDLKCCITGFKVLELAETPGLGDQVTEIDFCQQFLGKNLSRMKLTTTGEKDCIQAVTGATISSRAVTEDAVKNALAFIQKIISKNG
jgi:electron transport complex protein RnfG